MSVFSLNPIDSHLRAVVWVFWTATALLFYAYAGYPLLLALLAPFRRDRRSKEEYTPMISVLIAARNEEAGIKKKIEQTLALNYPADRMELLVLSDASTDQTDAIVQSFTDPRVRLIRVDPGRGKTNA